MEKKKKRPTIWLGRHKNKLLGLVFLTITPIICVICMFVNIFVIQPPVNTMFGNLKINQMENWRLPPNSQFLSFKSETGSFHTTGYVVGTLVISSQLPQDEIEEFYRIHYPDFAAWEWRGVRVTELESDTNGFTVYEIVAHSLWRIP